MSKNFNPILLAAYRCALKEKGLPERLASEIVLHWHDIFWQNAMAPR